jgi:hypothetical protein
MSPQVPRAGVDYPKTFGQFQEWFSTDEACFEYLASALAGGVRLPEMRRCRVLAHWRRIVDVQGVLTPDACHGRHDLRPHPYSAEDLVRGGLVRDLTVCRGCVYLPAATKLAARGTGRTAGGDEMMRT